MNSNNATIPAGPASNGTTSPSAAAATVDTGTMMTLLTLGPLSSCLSLPDLSAAKLPASANSSDGVQQWLSGLPTTSACTSLSWTLKPDYSAQLNAVATFQSQLQQLFPLPTTNATQGTVQPAGGSFFSSSALPSSSTGTVLPTGLPVWMGAVLASATLVHLVALVLHVCADFDALFPSIVGKQKPREAILPSTASESTATLVDEKESQPEPPKYAPAASTSTSGVEAMPGVICIGRRLKRLVVPLLLLSALGCVGVAVVLNSKFAPGAVKAFGSTNAGVSPPSVVSSALPTTSTTSSVAPATAASSISTPSSTVGATTSEGSLQGDTRSDTSSMAPTTTVTGTMTMTKLVRRQTNFFSAPPANSSSSSTSAFVAIATPNAALFPTPSSTSTAVGSSPTSTSTAPASATTEAVESGTGGDAGGEGARFVVERGDSMHRLWWIVMLDLVLWFAQRRRTRKQTAQDQARTTLLSRLEHPHPH